MNKLTELHQGMGIALQSAFSDYRVVFLNAVKDFAVERVPLVSYHLSLRPNYAPGYDRRTEKDMSAMTGTETELIPHRVVLTVEVHSDSIEEAGNMATVLYQTFGMAPCIADVGFKYTDSANHPNERWGVYGHRLEYTGWTMLDGRSDTSPLVQEIHAGVVGSGHDPQESTEDDELVVVTDI